MENSKAVILTYTPEPEKICAASARISTTQGSATEIYQNTNRDNIGKLISNVIGIGHKTIIEHASFTIAFENVSAFVEQFIIEFRLAAFTIKSRRYVDFSGQGVFKPEFRFNSDISGEKKSEIDSVYNDHIDFLYKEYEFLVERGIPKEDARFVLPYSFRSNIYCTVNARELLHIIYSAIYGRGSKFPEIVALGKSLLKQGTEILPDVFSILEKVENGTEDKEKHLTNLLKDKVSISKSKKEHSELITFTGNPEEIVAVSAIVNNTSCDTDDAWELVRNDDDTFNKVLEIIEKDRRKRELEQACFTFRINRITLSGLTHLVRHRIQSVNVPSFTEFGKSDDYIIPDTIKADSECMERYKNLWAKNQEVYGHFVTEGVVPEDLVYLYLSGNLMDCVTTMNGRQLYHFLRLRTCNRAQWEIRDIAIDMLDKLRKVAPKLFNRVGPACFMDGKCPEGKMTCGKMKEVCEMFGGELKN